MLENILILSGAAALFALYYGTPILFQHLRSRFNDAMQEDPPEPEPDRLDYPAAMAAVDQIQTIRERLDKLEELITYLEITPPESQQVTCSTAFQSEDTKQHAYTFAPTDGSTAALPAILTAAKAERAALRQSLSSLLQQLPETAVRHGQNGRQNSDQTQTKQTPIFRGEVVEKGA